MVYRSLLRVFYGEEYLCGCYVEEMDYYYIILVLLCEFYDIYYYLGNCYVYFFGKVMDEIIYCIEVVFGMIYFGNY